MKKKLLLTATSLSLATLVAFQGVAEADTVKVKSGDTLWSISKKYDVSLNEFMKLNKLSSTAIYVGQNLSVPGTASTTTPSTSKKQVNTSVNDPLNVRTGASVSHKAIGKLNHKTVVTVHSTTNGWSYIEANGIKGYVSSKYLTSVAASTPSTTHTVKKGDTLYKIAEKYNTTYQNIAKWNNMKSYVIFSGQKLVVSPTSIVKPVVKPIENVTSAKKHTVAKGDTLYKIAEKYNTTYQNIASWNNMKSYVIYSGQILTVSKPGSTVAPTPAPVPTVAKTHTVKKGDTLHNIAKNAGISVNYLMQLNGLSSSIIHVGQVVNISQGKFINPTEGIATSQYGYRTHPVDGKYKLHAGIDIAKSGTVPVVAFYDGVVTRSEWHSTYGNVVFIMHTIDGKKYEAVYAHLRNRTVTVGTQVKQGHQLGLMGSTGNVTGQHLHFEIHEGNWSGNMANSIDPRRFVY